MDTEDTDGDRLADALAYATDAHEGVFRTGTTIPYITHPVAVMEIVREHGGDTDQQIAALLHDVVEDAGGITRLDDIRACFGAGVAEMVLASTDHVEAPGVRRPNWWERKVAYLERMRTEEPRAALVTASDKWHNASAILMDYRSLGEMVWERFGAGRSGQLWYYRQLADILPERLALAGADATALGTAFRDTVAQIFAVAEENTGAVAVEADLAEGARRAATAAGTTA